MVLWPCPNARCGVAEITFDSNSVWQRTTLSPRGELCGSFTKDDHHFARDLGCRERWDGHSPQQEVRTAPQMTLRPSPTRLLAEIRKLATLRKWTFSREITWVEYSDSTGRLTRFNMADPVQGSTSNSQSLNRFIYGLSDPINNIDPTGLFNFKVEIPADWPCNPADNVACGCDPFESPFCGIGGSYPPSDSGGGGGSGDPCELAAREDKYSPSAVDCDTEKVYTSHGRLTAPNGGQVPMGVGLLESKFRPSNGIVEVPLITPGTPGEYEFETSFYFKRIIPPRGYSYHWEFTYMCHGKRYQVNSLTRKMGCAVQQ